MTDLTLVEDFKKIYHSKRSQKIIVKETKAILQKEAVNKYLIEGLLERGPLSSIWQGLKGAGQAVGGALKGAASGAKSGFQQTMAQQQQQARTQAYVKQINDLSKQVTKTKQKFDQEVLKQSETINAYHDAVAGLQQAMMQAEEALGQSSPELAQLKNRSVQHVEQLMYDLESEKEGIDSFLKSVKQQSDHFTATFGASKAKGRAQQQRDTESQEYGGRSMAGKSRAGTNRQPMSMKAPFEAPPPVSKSAKEKISKYRADQNEKRAQSK